MQSEEAIYDEFVETKTNNDLNFVLDAVIFLVAAVSYTYFTALFSNVFFQLNAIQYAIFLLLGTAHVLALNRSTYLALSYAKKFRLTLLLCVLIFIALYILNLFYHYSTISIIAFKGLAFGLPALVYYQWTVIDSLKRGSNKSKVWFGFEQVKDGKVTVYLNSVPLKIKITKSYFDEMEEVIETTFPGHLIFGKIFNKFLLDLNDETTIELFDERSHAFGWIFFEKRKHSYEVRCLDPELTVRENKIKDGSTIIARRVRKENATSENELLN